MNARKYLSRLKRIYREEGGVAAMEFAILAPVFFVVFFGIIEVALVFFADMMLQNALLDASRFVRIGSGISQDEFVDNVCNKAFILKKCKTNLKYQVKVITDYKTYNSDIAIVNYAGFTKMATEYNAGISEDIMLVRAYYEWDLFTGYIRDLFSTPGANARVIGGGVVFRNEPF